jgi:hypothetical protein
MLLVYFDLLKRKKVAVTEVSFVFFVFVCGFESGYGEISAPDCVFSVDSMCFKLAACCVQEKACLENKYLCLMCV